MTSFDSETPGKLRASNCHIELSQSRWLQVFSSFKGSLYAKIYSSVLRLSLHVKNLFLYDFHNVLLVSYSYGDEIDFGS